MFATAALFTVTLAGHAETVASASGSSGPYLADYEGQAFTVTTGNVNNITFNFYSYYTGAATAFGTGFLYSSVYTGDVADLGTASASLLGLASSNGSVYTFNSNLVLDAGTTYYFYENGENPIINGAADSYSGDNYYTDGTDQPFQADTAAEFLVTGQPAIAATPEPSSIALLGTGLLSIAGMARGRFRQS